MKPHEQRWNLDHVGIGKRRIRSNSMMGAVALVVMHLFRNKNSISWFLYPIRSRRALNDALVCRNIHPYWWCGANLIGTTGWPCALDGSVAWLLAKAALINSAPGPERLFEKFTRPSLSRVLGGNAAEIRA